MTTFKFTQLTPHARTAAMNAVRDAATQNTATLTQELEVLKAQSYEPDIDDMKLGRMTTAVSHKRNNAVDFQTSINDDLAFITYLQDNLLDFTEQGELVADLACQHEQGLEFDQYKGKYFSRYSADSETHKYQVTKMNNDACIKPYAAIIESNTTKKRTIEDFSSLSAALSYFKAHHKKMLSQSA